MTDKKKLIEVALPLDAINQAAAREKSIRHGHPSTLHLWWARRPLAAARAVIFAQMVDDPSARPELFPTEADQQRERERLFRIIEEMVRWENTTNEDVLDQARKEIGESWRRCCTDNAGHPRVAEMFDPDKLPAFHDPFAGGGALPLEAQRLGLEAHASDLNPVAVLINKAMIEIPPKFAGRPPVNPVAQSNGPSNKTSLIERQWKGAQGLAEDVLYYGQWMRDEAEKRIGHLYPKVEITEEMVRERPDLKPYQGRKLTVIAWLWARTVKSPNPAYADVDVPLASTFVLSTKNGKEAHVEPVIEGRAWRFEVKVGAPLDLESTKRGTKSGGSGSPFFCLMSGTPIPFDYVRSEANANRMGARLMVIVVAGNRSRLYLTPTSEHEAVAEEATPKWAPDADLPDRALGFRVQEYGIRKWRELFTPRQLVALSTLADLVAEAMDQVKRDCLAGGRHTNSARFSTTVADDPPSHDVDAYAEAVGVYLAFAVSKTSNRASTLCTFQTSVECPGHTFGRQALPMSWDYAEANTVAGPTGSFESMLSNAVAGLLSNGASPSNTGYASQADAMSQMISHDKIVSTDPPYYDNISYGELSDFFYIWLRRCLRSLFPSLFATLAVPKAEELVATPYRHGGKEKAEAYFLDGMGQAMKRLVEQTHPEFPVSVYYAFKQSENKDGGGRSSTGWETFIDAVIQAGFGITGTWPVRTERKNRKRNQGSNALASSVLLVCRRRPDEAPLATRREFVAGLKTELPAALAHLQAGNIAPVDLAQAAIGPGMAVYTRYAKVLDAEGKPVSVRDALALINQTLDETLAEQEGEFDADTRWALAWFEQQGFGEGEYGVAEMLSKAKNTSIAGIAQGGILVSRAGKVRLLRPKELADDWDPTTDSRLTVWEVVHQLVRVLESGGETRAAAFLRRLGGVGETARELAYRLYSIAERKGRPAEALSYNALVQSWPEIAKLAGSPAQPDLL